ncbi:FCD domain-containing protein [Sphingomonas oligophenolica]|uniref:FCD domain-containing protein n=1 Tax=Sphingomonas oligophenolica TaxID=301154 RepID=A0ABU9Y974_9SPHN
MEPIELLDAIRAWLTEFRRGSARRLPAERELAAVFSVSRAELRKALTVIEQEGQIRRHVGRGTFIVPRPGDSAATTEGVAKRTSPMAAMEARAAVEPELARLAALNATSTDFAAMRALAEEMRTAATWSDYAELDWQFHNRLAEATGNVLLIEIQRLLNGVRRHVVWGNLRKGDGAPPPDYHSFREHEEILSAIEAREGDRAMRAMRGHLEKTRQQLIETASSG